MNVIQLVEMHDAELQYTVHYTIYNLLRKGKVDQIDVAELTEESINQYIRRLAAGGTDLDDIKWSLSIIQDALAWLKTKRNRDRSREWREKKQREHNDRRPEVVTVTLRMTDLLDRKRSL